jgi:hypothetical protein
MSKTHWTQTPEGKEKMSVIQKSAWAKRRKKTRAHKIVGKAVAHERKNGTHASVGGIIKLLRQRRDQITLTIAILQQEVRRG